jgi:transposase
VSRHGHYQRELTDVPWLGCRVKAKYARHLRRDYRAVELAIETPWSNGPVEGQINRLKAIKRQMYGRAGFDLT